ncbi:hypothetical protein TorRG33x02_006370 [Trema orientale]|uniref:Uncharacterized protein n=1 Tax=Trema orientale TaxID=63057 RepID=A0A2P5G086_TREOI|nr:hypothetical protein TorRG33x02_006370 [Trema orientale]
MPFADNPIEELSAFAELHNKINRFSVLVSLLEGHNVGMLRQVAHDPDLPPHVLDIDLRLQLALRYHLASEGVARLEREALVGDSELAPA